MAAAGGVAVALSLPPAVDASAAVATPGRASLSASTTTVRGLDVSSYQHTGSPIDWKLLVREGIRFAAIKVSEGTYYVNPYYRDDARAAARSGLTVLSYVFANPASAGGAATARFALRAAGNARGRLPIAVDLENDPYRQGDDCYGLTIPAIIAWISAFTRESRALTGKWPIIYTTTAWWQECAGATAKFRYAPLWIAAYDGTPPTVPPSWPHWTFWQYNANGTLPGIGSVDLDYYSSTTNFLALTAAPPKHAPKNQKSKVKAKAKTKAKAKDQNRKPKPKPKAKPKAKAKAKPKPKAKIYRHWLGMPRD